MTKLAPRYTNETTGISYTLSADGNYYLPDLTLPDEPEYEIGRFGLMWRHYLKEQRTVLFTNLLTQGKLNAHLYEIDQTAHEQFFRMTEQMAKAEGITEELKARDQMLWVKKMTNIRARVEEVIREELIYS
ncbi:MAG: TnpV protein [Christensenellaceae bacterium]|jgi:hypothetical protein|nr:TnpV protein [Christensenellaceae bacterium]